MLIGSNNSLTYLEPSNYWFKIFSHFKRCQNIDYSDQYTFYGVRLFDFRLYVDKNNHIIVKNDNCEYPIFSFYEVLDYLNRRGDAIVLITLETDSLSVNAPIESKFIETCRIIEAIYEEIRFCGGYRKSDKKQLYEFAWEKKNGMPAIIRPTEWSWLYNFATKWCPMLVYKFNRKYIERFKGIPGYLMLNYVNKR